MNETGCKKQNTLLDDCVNMAGTNLDQAQKLALAANRIQALLFGPSPPDSDLKKEEATVDPAGKINLIIQHEKETSKRLNRIGEVLAVIEAQV